MTIWGVQESDTPTAPERWARIPRRWRIVIVIVVAAIALEFAVSLLSGVLGSPSAGGGTSSTFETTGSGTAALAQLLTDRGHPVLRSTSPIARGGLPAGGTVMVLDPDSWSAADTATLVRFEDAGGRVVYAGTPPGHGLLAALLGTASAPAWSPVPSGQAGPANTFPPLDGVESVVGGSTGSFTSTAGAVALLQGQGGLLGLAGGTGRGGAVVLASSAPFQNQYLGQADDAALALDLTGPDTRPILFDEYDHGYGHEGTGLAGLPPAWRWGLVLALFATVIWILSAARRFGPPESAERRLIPARVEYVDAMAGNLSELPPDRLLAVADTVRLEARVLLCRRVGVPPDASDTDIVHAARGTAVPESVVAPLLAVPSSSSELIAAGRALAWIEGERSGPA